MGGSTSPIATARRWSYATGTNSKSWRLTNSPSRWTLRQQSSGTSCSYVRRVISIASNARETDRLQQIDQVFIRVLVLHLVLIRAADLGEEQVSALVALELVIGVVLGQCRAVEDEAVIQATRDGAG
jgi:hypothetical protein